MRFNKGDLVLAKCIIGSQSKETENKGKFCYESSYGLVCEFHGQRRTLDSTRIKRYFPIDKDQLENDCRAMFPQVFKSIQSACESLLSPEDFGEIKSEELTISLLGGNVVIEPAPLRMNGIGTVREVAGFEISTFKHIPATHLDPPDVMQCSYKILQGDLRIAQAVVELLFRFRLDSHFMGIEDTRHDDWSM